MALERSFIVCLPGLAALDAPLFARIVSSSFYLSHDIRRNVELAIILLEERAAVRLQGPRLRHVHVDEASLTGIYRKAVRGVREGVKRSVHWGVKVEPLRRGFKPPTGYTPSPRGAPLTRDTCKPPLRFLIGCRGEPLRITARPKPADVTISLLNIALDRLEAGLQPLPA